MLTATRRDILGLAAVGAGTLAMPAFAQKLKAPAALLVPLSGASASIGLSIQRAAAIVPGDAKAQPLLMFDTGGSAEGAANAARQAVKRGARIILGPLFSNETAAVTNVVGSAFPILSFSNDESLIGTGPFLLGITAAQSVTAILGYARRRGVRRVVAFGGTSPWSSRGLAAAQRVKDALGLDLSLLPAPLSEGQALPAALRQAGKGEMPDALLVTDGGAEAVAAARALAGSNVQILASEAAPAAAGMAGAWVAGSDPTVVAEFATRYQQRYGAMPGSLAALAYDGMTIVRQLQASGTVDRAALSNASSSSAITGAIRFRADGTATRELAILLAGEKGYEVVDKSQTA